MEGRRVWLLAIGIDLVRHDEHGHGGAPQPPGEHGVLLGDARMDVDDEQDQVGGRDRAVRLLARERLDATGVQEARRVDEREPPAAPGRLQRHPVAGHPREVVRDRLAGARTAG